VTSSGLIDWKNQIHCWAPIVQRFEPSKAETNLRINCSQYSGSTNTTQGSVDRHRYQSILMLHLWGTPCPRQSLSSKAKTRELLETVLEDIKLMLPRQRALLKLGKNLETPLHHGTLMLTISLTIIKDRKNRSICVEEDEDLTTHLLMSRTHHDNSIRYECQSVHQRILAPNLREMRMLRRIGSKSTTNNVFKPT